eukprot:COSAG02_NODE_2013_length_10111_cov_24.161039_2_plen_636_part_00
MVKVEVQQGQTDGRSDRVEPGDVAAQLYLSLDAQDLEAAARCVAEASDSDLLQPSAWKKRQPPHKSTETGGDDTAYATWGLSAVHVLVRDSQALAFIRQVLVRVPCALSATGGRYKNGAEAQWAPIHLAAAYNSVNVVRLLLQVGGADQLEAETSKGDLPIHVAAVYSESVEVVQCLLDFGSGADQLQAETSKGDLPIHLAAAHSKSVEVVQCLLGENRGRLSVEVVQCLLGENPGRLANLISGERLWERNLEDCLPIHLAAAYSTSVEVVRLLLHVGGIDQLNAVDSEGCLPIHLAAAYNSSVEVVQCLLAFGGADQLSKRTSFRGRQNYPKGCEPVHWAAVYSHNAEVVRLLLDFGGADQLQLSDSEGSLPIHRAVAYSSNVELIRVLLDIGGTGQLLAEDSAGCLPIHHAAACSKCADVVRLLLHIGGLVSDQLHAKSSKGDLPIHRAAAYSESVEVLQCLLEFGGADQLQAKTSEGDLPIHLAATYSESVEVVQCLLEFGGADQLQAKTAKGDLPIHLAAAHSTSRHVVQLLLGRGSPRAARTTNGQTAVTLAMRRTQLSSHQVLDFVRLFIEAGVQLSRTELIWFREEKGPIFREATRRVSVSKVLASYFAGNISPLAAAVRPPPMIQFD